MEKEFVYKYYSNESGYAIENLANGCISLTSIDSQTDKTEGYCKYDNMPKWFSDLFTESEYEYMNFVFRIFCCTDRCDVEYLWKEYANECKGFCVGYRWSHIEKITGDQITKINYLDDVYKALNLDEFIMTNEEGKKIFDNFELKKRLHNKATKYERENEYRAIYTLAQSEGGPMLFNINYNSDFDNKKKNYISIVNPSNMMKLYSERFINKKCDAAAIYIGANMKDEYRQKLIKIATDKNIDIYEMKEAKEPFIFKKIG